MEIKVLPLAEDQKQDRHNAGWGYWSTFSDRLFMQRYTAGIGWQDATIGPYAAFVLPPGTTVLSYGQAIFEGCRAFRRPDGQVNLFRPWQHIKRFNRSADRLVMPQVPEADHLAAIIKLVELDHGCIPDVPGSSLYIRPIMFATDTTLAVTASKSYIHAVMTSPVSAHAESLSPISVAIAQTYARAMIGGTGDVKVAGNYAGALYLSEAVQKEGYEDVLWLDAVHHRYVEEVGTMNFAVVYNGKEIVTPALTGTILPGVTRDSILTFAPDLGYKVTETQLDVYDMLADIRSGDITEAFGMGTGAVVTAINKLGYRGEAYRLNNGEVGPVTRQLRQTLTDIQSGRIPDTRGWTLTI